jgi:hypothetical protein
LFPCLFGSLSDLFLDLYCIVRSCSCISLLSPWSTAMRCIWRQERL